jgi:hypothetical protein
MKHRRHFDPMPPRLKRVATILGIIDDLHQNARLLDGDIASEPNSALIDSLTSRRDKLLVTIAMLETRLADIRGLQVPRV